MYTPYFVCVKYANSFCRFWTLCSPVPFVYAQWTDADACPAFAAKLLTVNTGIIK